MARMANANGIWFRHYIDAHRNLKLRRLPESTQLFFWWLCELRKADVYPCDNSDLAWHLRVDEERVADDLARLREAGLIMDDDDVKGWAERQFETDGASSTDRVRKHREKKQSSKNDETQCNVSPLLHETPPEQSRDRDRAEQKDDVDARPGEDFALARTGIDVGLPSSVLPIASTDNPTDKQRQELTYLAESTGVSLEAMLAKMPHATWTKASARCAIDRYREIQAAKKQPKTFGDLKREKSDDAIATVMREIS
jgi:hypothetical protein